MQLERTPEAGPRPRRCTVSGKALRVLLPGRGLGLITPDHNNLALWRVTRSIARMPAGARTALSLNPLGSELGRNNRSSQLISTSPYSSAAREGLILGAARGGRHAHRSTCTPGTPPSLRAQPSTSTLPSRSRVWTWTTASCSLNRSFITSAALPCRPPWLLHGLTRKVASTCGAGTSRDGLTDLRLDSALLG